MWKTSSQSSAGTIEIAFIDAIVVALIVIAGLASRDSLSDLLADGLGLCGAKL